MGMGPPYTMLAAIRGPEVSSTWINGAGAYVSKPEAYCADFNALPFNSVQPRFEER